MRDDFVETEQNFDIEEKSLFKDLMVLCVLQKCGDEYIYTYTNEQIYLWHFPLFLF